MSTPSDDNRPTRRVQLAIEGTLPQRDLTPDEARQVDAAIAVRVDDAVAQADFSSAALPDFAAVLPDPHRVFADLASRTQHGADAQDPLGGPLTQLKRVLDELPPAEAGR